MWLIDSVIRWFYLKSFISTFARTMATNFSKFWLKLTWPQPPSHVTHLPWDIAIFAKTWISSFTTPMAIKRGRVMSYVEGNAPTLSSNLLIKWSVLFEKRHVSTKGRPQNSAWNIKHRQNHKLKAFPGIQKIAAFDSYRYTPL